MMIKLVSALSASFSLLAVTLPVHAADMLGDTLKFERVYPDFDTAIQTTAFTTVVTGVADAVFVGDTYVLVNPEANSIEFDFQESSAFIGDAFIADGFRISGFSHAINALSVSQASGITVVSLGLDASNRILVNLTGPFTASSFLELQVGVVPEPQTYALLLAGLAVVGLVARRRAVKHGSD